MKLLPVHKRDHRLWDAANASLRLAVLRGVTRPFARNVVVNEFPKSGGTWLSQMLSMALDLPFPQYRFPMIGSCLMQCHVLNPWNMRDVVVIWRDGRDVMVSHYHHLLLGHEARPAARARDFARRLGISDVEDVAANLPRFIERAMCDPVFPKFTWPRFAQTWHGRKGVVETRYEDLLTDAKGTLSRIVRDLGRAEPDEGAIARIVEKTSFKAQSGRAAGVEAKRSTLRKGIAGDWKNYFNDEAIEVFDHHAGATLEALGYDRGR